MFLQGEPPSSNEENEVAARFELSGVKREGVEINVHNDNLVVSSQSSTLDAVSEKDSLCTTGCIEGFPFLQIQTSVHYAS